MTRDQTRQAFLLFAVVRGSCDNVRMTLEECRRFYSEEMRILVNIASSPIHICRGSIVCGSAVE
jgi:hypothetical protein